jgi:demethylmenaquinone methyltransferase/2-methoxy-6-polyprenyl-1,4-benzoquinol methylase
VPLGLVRHGAPLLGRVTSSARPDRHRALESYGALAGTYDTRTAAGAPYRLQTVRALAPVRGEAILDVGCGTGLNFGAVEEGIGPNGRLIGLDPCREMLDLARVRAEEHGWGNVTLVEAAGEDVRLDEPADAALLCGVHDVMRSPAALANVLAQLREGARVVAGGAKWTPWWHVGSVPMNLSTRAMNRDFVTTFEGFHRPWSHLAALVPDLEVTETYMGAGYVAVGTRP